jgi:hypothetical protein
LCGIAVVPKRLPRCMVLLWYHVVLAMQYITWWYWALVLTRY